MRLLALGHTNQEIAKMLFISVRTAETHRAHIMQKLRLSTRAELVRYALDNGLLDEAPASTSGRAGLAPAQLREHRDHARHALDEGGDQLGVAFRVDLAGEPDLAVAAPRRRSGAGSIQSVRRITSSRISRATSSSETDEGADEVGARDDADEQALIVDDRQALDVPVEHGCAASVTDRLRADRERGCRHRLARRPPGELDDVALGEHTEHVPVGVDHRQTGDPDARPAVPQPP